MSILLVNMANIQYTLTYVKLSRPVLENVTIDFAPTKNLAESRFELETDAEIAN